MKNKTLLMVLSWGFVLACLFLIFYFSSQTATVSKNASDGLVKKLLEFFHIELTSKIVRKTAHALEFFGLCLAFNISFGVLYEKFNPMISFFSTAFYASTDELHQIFVEGRACRLNDLCIDLIGAFSLTLLLMTAFYIYKKKNKRSSLCQF